MAKAVIAGATSGIGKEVAKILIGKGWQVGVAGRRTEQLEELRAMAPDRVYTAELDITRPDATDRLDRLVTEMGGMDLYLHSSGIGYQNPELDPEKELRTVQTNGEGFTRMVSHVFHLFRSYGGGHLAVISSIAGTKGMGAAPAYSATKRFQNTYIEALSQLNRMGGGARILFTDIRPGFVATDLLKGGKYPLLMRPEKVARKIVRAIEKKRKVVVIDWRYALLVFFWRLIPRWLWIRLNVKSGS